MLLVDPLLTVVIRSTRAKVRTFVVEFMRCHVEIVGCGFGEGRKALDLHRYM